MGCGKLPGESGGGEQGPHYGRVCGRGGQERGWKGGVYGGRQEEAGVGA